MRLVIGDGARNKAMLKLQREANMPSIEVMNLINRRQNSLSRQLSKELSELITVINLRKSRKIDNGQIEQIENGTNSEWDFE